MTHLAAIEDCANCFNESKQMIASTQRWSDGAIQPALGKHASFNGFSLAHTRSYLLS